MLVCVCVCVYMCVCVCDRQHWNVMMSNQNATYLDVLYSVIIKYCRWNWMHWAHKCVCVCFMNCVNKHLIHHVFGPTCFVTLFLHTHTHSLWMGSRCGEYSRIFQLDMCVSVSVSLPCGIFPPRHFLWFNLSRPVCNHASVKNGLVILVCSFVLFVHSFMIFMISAGPEY